MEKVSSLTNEKKALVKQLNQLKEDVKHNQLLPSDLYRMISELKTKYDNQLLQYSNQIKSLNDIVHLQANHINELLRTNSLYFEILRKHKTTMSGQKYRGTKRLPNNAPTRWIIINRHRNRSSSCSSSSDDSDSDSEEEDVNDFFIGVLGRQETVSAESYTDATAFGWTSTAQIVGGIAHHMKKGVADHISMQAVENRLEYIVCAYDPRTHILTLHLESTGITYSMQVPLKKVYIHFSVSDEFVVLCVNDVTK